MMQPDFTTPTRPKRPIVRWLMLGCGGLVAAFVALTVLIIIAAAIAAPKPPMTAAAAPPAPSIAPSPEPTSEPTPEPTAEPTPEPTAIATPSPEPTPLTVQTAGGPTRAYYADVRSKLIALNGAMLEVSKKTTELQDNPLAVYTDAWVAAWAVKSVQVTLAADEIDRLPRYAGAEALYDEAAGAAGESRRYVEHIARGLDAARVADTATADGELAAHKAAFDAYLQHLNTAIDMLP